jgi:hypothetical protein
VETLTTDVERADDLTGAAELLSLAFADAYAREASDGCARDRSEARSTAARFGWKLWKKRQRRGLAQALAEAIDLDGTAAPARTGDPQIHNLVL